MASHFQENLHKNIEKSKLYIPQFPLVGNKMKYPHRLSALDQKSSILLTMLGRRKKSVTHSICTIWHLSSPFTPQVLGYMHQKSNRRNQGKAKK